MQIIIRWLLGVALTAPIIAMFAAPFLMARAQDVSDRLVDALAGEPWKRSSAMYAAEQWVRVGLPLDREAFVAGLERRGYARSDGDAALSRGEFRARGARVDVAVRTGSGGALQVHFDGGRVRGVENRAAGALREFRLEPEILGSVDREKWVARSYKRLPAFPTHLIDAVIAAEDRRFREHLGVDLRGVARAAWANFEGGGIREGASTITQQLVKNHFLDAGRNWSRKLREVAYALLLERRLSKDRILELYLNEIYLGDEGPRGIFGFWEGARHYFGKDATELTLAESATLAGLIKAPGRFAPTSNLQRARARRDQVLGTMLAMGRIDAAAHGAAVGEAVLERQRPRVAPVQGYFAEFARAELDTVLSVDDAARGVRVATTLDVRLQRIAEAAVARGLEAIETKYPSKVADREQLQAALVALDPHTAEVRAMVGGRDYGASQFNRSSQARRQPGSVFKPVVFLAALEAAEAAAEAAEAAAEAAEGDDVVAQGSASAAFDPRRPIFDGPLSWAIDDEPNWEPRNYADDYRGAVSFEETLEHSLNGATLRIAERVGLARVSEMADRLRLASGPFVPSAILGSLEVSPLDVAAAYAAIASGGVYREPTALRSITGRDGMSTLPPRGAGTRVASESAAARMTEMLAGVIDRGTGTAVRRLGLRGPVAGKTGTTNDGRDAWFAGFTPDLVVVVWVGFDTGPALDLSGGKVALPIWTEFVKAAVAGRVPGHFPRPEARDDPDLGEAKPVPVGLDCAVGPPLGDERFVELALVACEGVAESQGWLAPVVESEADASAVALEMAAASAAGEVAADAPPILRPAPRQVASVGEESRESPQPRKVSANAEQPLRRPASQWWFN